MVYAFLKITARIALQFYCRKIIINKNDFLQLNGPLLIAANHPNSFLDAIILATIFKHPVYSLTRGDAFANKLYTLILRQMNMLPVYRLSEGAENLENNYSTFTACQHIFTENGIVLIFSEGRCINEWHLRPLKKGTARLAMSAWQQNIPLKVLPVGINYSCFRKFGKIVILNFGKVIMAKDFDNDSFAGKAVINFTSKLNEQLKQLVFEIGINDKERMKKEFYVHQSLLKTTLLFIPAIAGWLLHFPLYYTIVFLIRKKAQDHYDSILVGLLFILYPFYLAAITLITFYLTKNLLSFLLIIIIPFTAWAKLQLKKQG
ncbi:MAG: 1-acyl-sn-glycerol-3-phosphate acyltransferase [Ginsengibacter sp.]